MGRGRSEKQKQKLLYMAQLLYERTDEDHPVTTQEVIDYLEANGIRSERKTVYTDMEELEDFGLDIIRVRERPGGYYLASRKFELAELKAACGCRAGVEVHHDEEVERADCQAGDALRQGTGKAAPQTGRGDQPQQGGQ